MKKRLTTRKILAASLGIGAVSYVVACGGATSSSNGQDAGPDGFTSGNLMPAQVDAGVDAYHPTSGNLMGYPIDSGTETSTVEAGEQDARPDVVTSGNLMAPPDSGNGG
jgi:hypothetical protein